MPNVNDLESMISALGWTLKSVKPPTTASNGRFVATIEPPDGGQPVTRDGDTPERALANALTFAQRRNAIRTFANLGLRITKWNTPWHEQLEDIASGYGKLPVYDEKAVPAWQALARESQVQADAIRNQLKVSVTDDPQPYKDHAAMIHDVHHNGAYTASRAHADHPIWSTPDQVNFRIAHDVLGHAQSGGGYDWPGENAAVATHMPMLSPLARRALFTESLGKTAHTMHHGTHAFGPQKVGLMEDFLGPVEKMNGEHVYVPHGQLAYPANIAEQAQQPAPLGWEQNPMGIWQHSPADGMVAASVHVAAGEAVMPEHTMDALGSTPRQAYTSIEPDANYPKLMENTPVDPNHYYQTPKEYVQPYMAKAGSGEDYLNRGDVENNVSKFDTNAEDPFVQLSDEEQRKTIRNAFAVVILSPKKSLTWNAAHFQAIANLDSSAKPEELFDAIMQEKNYHNTYRAAGNAVDPFEMGSIAQVGFSRARYETTLKKLHNYMLRSTGLSDAEAWQQSKKTIMQMFTQVEPFAMQALERENEMRGQGIDPATQEIKRNKKGQPSTTTALDKNGMRLRIKTWEMTNAWLDSIMSGYKIPKGKQQGELTAPDQLGGGLPLQMASAMRGWLAKTASDFPEGEQDEEGDEDGPNETTGVDIEGRYGGAMYTHLEAISRLDQNVLESMRQYAVKDISEDGGRGFIFRAGCVQMNIPGIGPKTASFAWLLIHPHTSELGIIDTHALRGLGFEENALNDKNYYAMERMQRAAKDSTGYADMPLGKYHWGFWDMLRTPGSVSDHRLLRPRKYLPWYDPDVYHGAEHIVSRAGVPLYVGDKNFEQARPIMEAVKRNAQVELGQHTKNGVKPLNMKPTHYAQGLLPQQPPEEFREAPIWKLKARYTTPSWIDPTTNQPYPEAIQGYETPAMRAASTGWDAGGWEEKLAWADPNLISPGFRRNEPGEWSGTADQKSPSGARICPLCGQPEIGKHPRDFCPVKQRPISHVRRAANIDFDKYVQEAQGDVAAAQRRLYDELKMQGMDAQSAWSASVEYEHNWSMLNPTHHQLETYPERYPPEARPRTFGEAPEPMTDMSQFEQQVSPEEGTTMERPEPVGEAPKCPNCGGQLAATYSTEDSDVSECKNCHHEFMHDQGDPNMLHDMGVNKNYKEQMPEFPEATGDSAPATPGFRSPEEEEYYRTAAERCPGTWQEPVDGKCPECGAQANLAGLDSRVPGKVTPHRPGGGRALEDIKLPPWKRGGWVPEDAGSSPHGGYANTSDTVCPDCNNRVYGGAEGHACRNCGRKGEPTDQRPIAGPYDPERADMKAAGWTEG